MKIKIIRFFAAAMGLLLAAASAQAMPIAHLTLRSESGDFIGQGGNFDITYTPDNSDFFSAQIFGLDPGLPTTLLFVLGTVTGGSDNTFASLFFGTDQPGIPIQPGFFPDAERFASPGHPELDVSFQNRGCNTLTGSFTVEDTTFGPSSTPIQTFRASFEQHCEGVAPALFGTFSFDASAAAIPEPATFTLVACGLLSLVGLVKRSTPGLLPLLRLSLLVRGSVPTESARTARLFLRDLAGVPSMGTPANKVWSG